MNKKHVISKIFLSLALTFMVTGCATQQISPEEMTKQLQGFDLPEKPIAGKGVVYFIYEADLVPSFYPERVSLSYGISTRERLENDQSKAYHFMKIFGLTTDEKSESRKPIGILAQGHYTTVQFEPGIYEIALMPLEPLVFVPQEERRRHIEVEKDKTYFVKIRGHTSYNEYARSLHHYLNISNIEDPLEGRYLLFKNFKVSPEK